MTHCEAMLDLLMRHPNEKVPMPEIMAYTAEKCAGFCTAVNSRASDLRNLGYNVINSNKLVKGKNISSYMLVIKKGEIESLRRLFYPGQKIPHFSQVKAAVIKSKPAQVDMFAATIKPMV